MAPGVRQLVGDVPLGGSAFPPIAEYAFLSDTECTALVAPSGNVEWMCLPRMDGPSVFGAMLDRDAGGFRLGPADTMVPAGRRYLPGTMVARDHVGHAHRLGDRPRRAADRAMARREGALEHPPPLADRLRRRPRPAADAALRQRLGRDQPRLRAGARLRPQARRLGVRRRRLPQGGRARPRARTSS